MEIEYCDYKNINEKVTEWIDSNPDFNDYLVYITDISVNEEVAAKINLLEKGNLDIYLYDHHKTAEWLNQYRWASVQERLYDRKTCGTETFYFLTGLDYSVKEFVELVRLYDTWDWKVEENDIPKKLNDLLYIYGRDQFVNLMVDRIKAMQFPLDSADYKILKINQDQIDKYINGLKVFKHAIGGLSVGIVYADRNISEIGSTLAEIHPDIAYFMIININFGVVSYRTSRKDIDLSEIAKKYNGGGHKQASGSPFDNESLSNLIAWQLFDAEDHTY